MKYTDLNDQLARRCLNPLPDSEMKGQLLSKPTLGKIYAWLDQRKPGKTLQKFLHSELGISEANSHAYSCARVFAAVRDGVLPGVTEEDYDACRVRVLLASASMIGCGYDAELAKLIKVGTCVEAELRQLKEKITTKTVGSVYVMVTSAYPKMVKIGRSGDPKVRATGLPRETGALLPFIVVWEEYVSDQFAAENALKGLFASRRLPLNRVEFFRISPQEAIQAVIQVAREFPTTRRNNQRNAV